MPRTKKEIKEIIETKSNNLFSNLSNIIGNDLAGISEGNGYNQTFVDTGSYALNALLSGSLFGGICSDKIIGLAGEPSAGKSYFALAIAKHFQDIYPNGQIIDFETEGYLKPKDPFTLKILKDRKIDVNRFHIVPVGIIEEFRTQVSKFLGQYEIAPKEAKVPTLLILDSLSNLSTKKEVEDIQSGTDKRDMTRPGLIRGTFRALTLKLNSLNIPMIVTNHVYQVVGAYVPTKEIAGGGGLKYAASTIIMLSKSKDKEDDQIIGANIKCTATKSRYSRENKQVIVNLSYKGGLQKYSGLLELAEKAGIFIKKAKGYDFNGSTVYERDVDAYPEKYFSKEILDQLEQYITKEFSYGQLDGTEENE